MAQRRDKRATQAEILEAAEELFSDRGFAAASLADIAKRAQVTKSLIHHHFGTKEQLWQAIKDRHLDEYRALQLKMLDEPTLDETTLARSIQGYFRFLSQRPRLSRMLSWATLEKLGSEDQVLAMDLIELGVEKLRTAQSEGTIRRDLEPVHIILLFLLAVDNWFVNGDRLGASSRLGPVEAEGFVRDLIEIVLHGVVPRQTKE